MIYCALETRDSERQHVLTQSSTSAHLHLEACRLLVTYGLVRSIIELASLKFRLNSATKFILPYIVYAYLVGSLSGLSCSFESKLTG